MTHLSQHSLIGMGLTCGVLIYPFILLWSQFYSLILFPEMTFIVACIFPSCLLKAMEKMLDFFTRVHNAFGGGWGIYFALY